MPNLNPEQQSVQQQICQELGVSAVIDVDKEINRRTEFLANLALKTNAKALVVGISGGVDSLLTGALAQKAAVLARSKGADVNMIALRLPYGVQLDDADARASLNFIAPDKILDVNVKTTADAMLSTLLAAGLKFNDAHHQDFIHGNIKARARMVALYAVAGANNGLVLGTDQAAEFLMGFSTKFGDNAADAMPLTGLCKRQVRALASALGAPENLVFKVPTADLESLDPQKPDETALGITYDQVDDFLEGKDVPLNVYDTIIAAWNKTAHKRYMPVSP